MRNIVKKETIQIKYPKYYRQRYIMTLLQNLENDLTGMEFQKVLFLSQRETKISYYDFISSTQGWYSFQAVNDLEVLHNLGWLEIENNHIRVLRNLPHEKGLKQAEALKLHLFARGKKYRQEHLFSSNSAEQNKVQHFVDEPVLFTIGYEGISFEQYVNRLMHQGVRLLCDVRMNPISRKFGFSKGRLSELLPTVGIEYRHIPELGIASGSRKSLHTASDYQHLFADYKKGMRDKKKHLFKLTELMGQYGRLALTCFERKPSLCHRHCISDYMEKKNNLTVVHL
ncbi:MAG: DUF488 domain-containing protein [Candidatus Electrothrix sp. ATG1]|nr:DUF488 domain-containing protein [Candidatus Electrothrix sp. ATG1]